jgi:hypothetical protein
MDQNMASRLFSILNVLLGSFTEMLPETFAEISRRIKPGHKPDFLDAVFLS